MATHSSILAWRIPWTEEPGGLQSMGLQTQTQLKRLSTHTSRKLNVLENSYVVCIPQNHHPDMASCLFLKYLSDSSV